MTKPIRPDQIDDLREDALPPEVITVINELIVDNWDGHAATFQINKAVARIANQLQISRDQVYNKHYLDIEGIFRKAGWDVKFEKPGYNEDFPATFTFSRPERSH